MPRRPKFALSAALLLFAGSAGAESLTSQEEELVALVNQARVDAGLTPLQADAGLSSVARAHSLDMATTGFFSHSSPTTGEMGDRLAAAGVDFLAAGENIALNADVQGAHASLLGSAAHRQNLLSPDVSHLGVGIVSNGRFLLVTELFVRPGARFTARIPTIDPVVAEASPAEVRRVEPAGDSAPLETAEAGALTVVPNDVHGRTPTVQQIPMLQVRPMPMPMPAPPYPTIGRGYWILGPRGNWVQVRVAPVPVHRRFLPRSRVLY